MGGSKIKFLVKGFLFILFFFLLAHLLVMIAAPKAHPNIEPYKQGYRQLWKEVYENNNYDIISIGTSYIYCNINPYIMKDVLNKNCLNMATPSNRVIDSYYLLKELFKFNEPELVFLDISANRLYIAKNKGYNVSFSLYWYPYMKPSLNKAGYFNNVFPSDFRVKLLIPDFHTVTLSSIRRKINESFRKSETDDETIVNFRYKGKGFFPHNLAFGEETDMGTVSLSLWEPEKVDLESIKYIKKIIDLCKSRGTEIVLISMPYLYDGFCAVPNYHDYYLYVNDFAMKNEVDFIDLNYAKPVIFTPEQKYYFDFSHLNEEGAEVFTKGFAGFLAEYLTGNYDKEKYFYNSYEEVIKSRE